MSIRARRVADSRALAGATVPGAILGFTHVSAQLHAPICCPGIAATAIFKATAAAVFVPCPPCC
jgi:hypothetical protein